ncbi:MAG: hypothetical protein JSU63_22010 [Phycisphaerales bacterium]|nr:MAG: hypothetical protein JSU63_22010 [Phycisphaerales bacterium]
MAAVNLIPWDLQLAITRQRHIRRWVMSFAIAASLVLIAFGLDWVERARADNLAAEHKQLQTQANTVHAELKAVTAKSNQLLLQIERAKALRDKRAWSGVFALIGSCMPDDCWLISVATKPEKPELGSARVSARSRSTKEKEPQGPVTIDAPRKLIIEGYAPDDAKPLQFVDNLNLSGAFARVNLESTQVEPVLDGSYYRFELLCEW